MTKISFKNRMKSGEILSGTFMKTPAHELVEVFAKSKLDFLTLDAEHAPFDRERMDICLAMARALSLPTLVRVPTGSPSEILKALDSGATGIIIPHVDSAEKARKIARASRFGHGGRGYAGSTRWAGFATRPMSDVLQQSIDETVVIAQIEEPEAVDAIDEIAALGGIDGLFVGPADLAVCYGETDINAPVVRQAMERVGQAAKKHGKTLMTFAPDAASCADLNKMGVTMFFVASEQSFILKAANEVAEKLYELK